MVRVGSTATVKSEGEVCSQDKKQQAHISLCMCQAGEGTVTMPRRVMGPAVGFDQVNPLLSLASESFFQLFQPGFVTRFEGWIYPLGDLWQLAGSYSKALMGIHYRNVAGTTLNCNIYQGSMPRCLVRLKGMLLFVHHISF